MRPTCHPLCSRPSCKYFVQRVSPSGNVPPPILRLTETGLHSNPSASSLARAEGMSAESATNWRSCDCVALSIRDRSIVFVLVALQPTRRHMKAQRRHSLKDIWCHLADNYLANVPHMMPCITKREWLLWVKSSRSVSRKYYHLGGRFRGIPDTRHRTRSECPVSALRQKRPLR